MHALEKNKNRIFLLQGDVMVSDFFQKGLLFSLLLAIYTELKCGLQILNYIHSITNNYNICRY